MSAATSPTPDAVAPDAIAPDAVAPNGGPSAMVPRWRTRVLPPAVVFFSFIGLWYLYARFALDANGRAAALSYPHTVVTTFFGGGPEGDQPWQLLSALWLTFLVALVGLVIAMAVGVLFAVLMSQAQWVETSFYPYAVFLQTVPILALVPLIGLLFGFGFWARILVCVIISLFPIVTNTLFGLKSAERSMHELFTLHHAGRWTRLTKLQLPAALPAMFTGFQISAGLSVIGAIVGGFFFQR